MMPISSRAQNVARRLVKILVGVFTLGILAILFSMALLGAPPRSSSNPTRVSLVQTPTLSLVNKNNLEGSSQPVAPANPAAYVPPVDANTVALYRFDSALGNVVSDETNHYPATLMGNAMVTSPGWYGNALSVDGANSYARTGYLGNLSSGTIEAYVDFSAACFLSDGRPTVTAFFAIASAINEATGQTVLFLGSRVGLMFGIYSNGAWRWVDSGINPCRYLNGPTPPAGPLWPYEKWRYHHVAATWGPRGMEMWVDGVLHGVGNSDPNSGIQPYPYMCNPQMQLLSPFYPRCTTPVLAPPYPPGDYTGGLSSFTNFWIGCDTATGCFKGRVDELRISNIQRTFNPIYDPAPSPSATATATGLLPDFGVTNIQVPLSSNQAMTHTIWVKVINQGSRNFNAPIGEPLVGKGSGERAGRAFAYSPSYTNTTNYFFYVDVYVDRPAPAHRLDPGNCPTSSGGTSWSWVYNLVAGQSTWVPIDCWLGPGTHSFYAQVDMCDDLSGVMCSANYGYVLEKNEDNNTFPKLSAIHSWNPFSFIPLVGK